MTAEEDSMTLNEVPLPALGSRSVATRPQGRARKTDPGPGGANKGHPLLLEVAVALEDTRRRS